MAVNFCSDALVVINNANGGPDSRHNLLGAISEFISVYSYDQAIELIRYDCHKRCIYHNKFLLNPEMDHSNFVDAASDILQNVDLFDLP